LVAVFFAAVLALLLFGDPLFAVALVDVLLLTTLSSSDQILILISASF